MPTLGSGDWRNARNLEVASSTSSRLGGRAEMSSPAAMPAMVGCRPDSTAAIHSTRPTTAYTDVRHTSRRLSSAMTARHTTATAVATASIESE